MKEGTFPLKFKELQSFLQVASCYRRFIEDFASDIRPLINLIKKNV